MEFTVRRNAARAGARKRTKGRKDEGLRVAGGWWRDSLAGAMTLSRGGCLPQPVPFGQIGRP